MLQKRKMLKKIIGYIEFLKNMWCSEDFQRVRETA